MGFIWIVDKWPLDELVGRKGMSWLNMDWLDIGRLGFEGTLDFLDSMFSNNDSDSDIYYDNDDKWRWD